MRVLGIVSLMLLTAVVAGGQVPPASRPPVLEPSASVGLFTLDQDGSLLSRATQSGSRGEDFSAGVWSNECRNVVGSNRIGSSGLRSQHDSWEFEGKVLSQTADQAVVDLTWTRVRAAGVSVDPAPQSRRVTLPLVQLVTIDMADAGSSAACPNGYAGKRAVLGAKYGYPPGTVVVNGRPTSPGGFDAELWLVHRVPGQPENVLSTSAHIAAGRGATFDFAPMQITVTGGSVSVHVKGQLRLQGSALGRRLLLFDADREAVFTPTSRPARDRLQLVPEGSAIATPEMPGPDDVLEFEMPALNVRGLSKVPDVFSVRLRLRPAKS